MDWARPALRRSRWLWACVCPGEARTWQESSPPDKDPLGSEPQCARGWRALELAKYSERAEVRGAFVQHDVPVGRDDHGVPVDGLRAIPRRWVRPRVDVTEAVKRRRRWWQLTAGVRRRARVGLEGADLVDARVLDSRTWGSVAHDKRAGARDVIEQPAARGHALQDRAAARRLRSHRVHEGERVGVRGVLPRADVRRSCAREPNLKVIGHLHGWCRPKGHPLAIAELADPE